MPAISEDPPAVLHRPGDLKHRPKGILKNPSFSTSGDKPPSPPGDGTVDMTTAPTVTATADQKELTLQNTLQNAGHRHSSSGARRASATRRHSQPGRFPGMTSDEGENMRLKWDEANLYLAEQQKTSTMKITEPKTPYEHARDVPDEEEEEEAVAIDPRYVDVDELDQEKRAKKGSSENDIPGLELGDPEELGNAPPEDEDPRIIRAGSLSREGSTASREKHVNVAAEEETPVGMPSREEMEKHKKFEELRKKHYEMRDIKGLLGHPEDVDAMDEDEDERPAQMPNLPSRGVNGAR